MRFSYLEPARSLSPRNQIANRYELPHVRCTGASAAAANDAWPSGEAPAARAVAA